MPTWYFEKSELKNTPSFRDGIEPETEARYRREGARFLMECGMQMGLRHETMATGVVFYHRFYMFHSFNEFQRYVTATCCLFLAGKVEETPKKCKDIVKAARAWLESKNLKAHAEHFSDESIKEIMVHERILLQTIKFDLQVDHPYGYLLKYAKTLKGNQEQINSMVQMAWTFINDSFCTTLCLQWEPEIIAIALMYLTSKLSKLEVTDWTSKSETKSLNWWDQFVEGLRIDILEDICHQILDLYATQQAAKNAGSTAHTTTTTTPTKSSNTTQNSNQSGDILAKPQPGHENNTDSHPQIKKKPTTPVAQYQGSNVAMNNHPLQQPPPLPPPTYDIKSTSPTSAKLIRNFGDNPPYPPYQPPPGFTQNNFYQPPPPGMYPPPQMGMPMPPQAPYNMPPNSFPGNPTNLPPPHHNMYPNSAGMPYYAPQTYQASIPPPPPPGTLPLGGAGQPPPMSFNYPPQHAGNYANNRPNYGDQLGNGSNNNTNNNGIKGNNNPPPPMPPHLQQQQQSHYPNQLQRQASNLKTVKITDRPA